MRAHVCACRVVYTWVIRVRAILVRIECSPNIVLVVSGIQVKLAVLKFYKIDNDGKISRLRRECPNCGAGVFMASMFNRQYCGKCCLTYTFAKPEEETA